MEQRGYFPEAKALFPVTEESPAQRLELVLFHADVELELAPDVLPHVHDHSAGDWCLGDGPSASGH